MILYKKKMSAGEHEEQYNTFIDHLKAWPNKRPKRGDLVKIENGRISRMQYGDTAEKVYGIFLDEFQKNAYDRKYAVLLTGTVLVKCDFGRPEKGFPVYMCTKTIKYQKRKIGDLEACEDSNNEKLIGFEWFCSGKDLSGVAAVKIMRCY